MHSLLASLVWWYDGTTVYFLYMKDGEHETDILYLWRSNTANSGRQHFKRWTDLPRLCEVFLVPALSERQDIAQQVFCSVSTFRYLD